MLAEWPLVGREPERLRLRTLLESGARGAVLAGPPGVGKTRLATDWLELATGEGFVALRASATQASSLLPFGAFAPLIPDLPVGLAQTDMLRQVTQAIVNRRGQRRGVALLIDDAHLLDRASAALTHQLATNETVFMLVTVRSGEPSPDAVMALWKDGILERFDLAPFPEAEVESFLTEAVGGPIDRATLHFFVQRTQGNALFLRELLLAALESGSLFDDNGVWRVRGRVPASSRLLELLEARLGVLQPSERDGLVALAVGEPLGVLVFAAISGEPDIAAYETRHLVRVESDRRRLQVRLAHPLYGDLLRAGLSPLTSRTICRRLAEATESLGARRREDVLRVATWQLEGGGPLRGDLLLAAAQQARARWDLPLAENLARAAAESGLVFPATLLLGQLLFLQGRAGEAEQLLAKLMPAAADDAQRVQLAAARIDNLVMGLGRLDDAQRVVEETAAMLDEDRWRVALSANRARLSQLFGQMRAALAELEPNLDRAEGAALVDACLTAGSAYASMGQTESAVAVAERGYAAHAALAQAPMLGRSFHRNIQCRALTYAGRLDEADALARPSYLQAIAEEGPDAQGVFAMTLARNFLHRGAVAQAEHFAREAVGLFRDWRSPFALRLPLIPLANAVALLGRADEARGIIRQLDALDLPPEALFGPELLQARAWTEVAAGDIPAGLDLLRAAAAMGQAGELVLRSAALHDLARLGRAQEAVVGLTDLAGVLEGPLIQARVKHAAALVDRDGEALESAAADFEQMGAILFAAEATADATAAWYRVQEKRRASAAERRMQALRDRCEGALTPALSTTGEVRVALTARELEIARLAAEGVPNRDIAARLFLSLHTVQNKLHTTYEKLGVQGREALAEALRGI